MNFLLSQMFLVDCMSTHYSGVSVVFRANFNQYFVIV